MLFRGCWLGGCRVAGDEVATLTPGVEAVAREDTPDAVVGEPDAAPPRPGELGHLRHDASALRLIQL